MTASFPTSVKSFTTKVDGTDDVLASHMNDVQAEIVAVETSLITTLTTLTWVPTWTNLTTTGSPTYTGRYIIVGKLVFFTVKIIPGGGSTASTAASTRINNLPIASLNDALFIASDSSMQHLGQGFITGTNLYTPAWAADASNITLQGWYEIA